MAKYARMYGSYQRSDFHAQLVPVPSGPFMALALHLLLAYWLCCLQLATATKLHGRGLPVCNCHAVSVNSSGMSPLLALQVCKWLCRTISAAGSFPACTAAGNLTLVTAAWSFAGACRQPLAYTAPHAASPVTESVGGLSTVRMSHIWAACPSSCQSLACIPGSAALPLQTKPFPVIQTKAHLYSSPDTVNMDPAGAALYEKTLPWYVGDLYPCA